MKLRDTLLCDVNGMCYGFFDPARSFIFNQNAQAFFIEKEVNWYKVLELEAIQTLNAYHGMSSSSESDSEESKQENSTDSEIDTSELYEFGAETGTIRGVALNPYMRRGLQDQSLVPNRQLSSIPIRGLCMSPNSVKSTFTSRQTPNRLDLDTYTPVRNRTLVLHDSSLSRFIQIDNSQVKKCDFCRLESDDLVGPFISYST